MNEQDQEAFEALAKTKPVFAYPAAKKVWQAALAHRDAQNPYRQAIEDELIVRELGVAKDDPVAELSELINWEVDVSHDPRVSERARKEQAQLAEVTRQRDELVVLLKRHDKAHLRLDVPYCEEVPETIADAYADSGLAEDTSAAIARIQSGQPKGEWIDECDEMLSIPLRDGTRLKIGECFVATDTYPFFSGGEENYNARLGWCDASKCLYYDIYPVSDRVRGCAVGGSMEDIEWNRIDRRPDIPKYQPKEQRDEQ